MLDAAREAQSFVADLTREGLRQDRIRSLAIVKSLEIIGEAASKVTPEFRDAHPRIPWSDVIGFRHVLVHNYFEVDLDIVWDVLEVDLPPLIEEVASFLPPWRDS